MLHVLPSPLAAVVALPLAAAVAMPWLRRWPNLRDAAAVIASLLTAALLAGLVPDVRDGARIGCRLLDLPGGLELTLAADATGLNFALVASGLWVVTIFYAIGYMRALDEHAITRFTSFFALSIAAALGVAFSANLLTLFVFYEILSLATWPLVTHHDDEEGFAGGRRYLAYLLGASLLLELPALIWVYQATGSLDFAPGGILAGHLASPGARLAIVTMLVLGFAKCAIMPLHAWLPAAMVAPTPVSALLHAVAVVKVGVFSVVRVLEGIAGPAVIAEGAALPVAILAGFTILAAGLLALLADDLKRLLAYSTISQLSYIVLGAALGSPAALVGAKLHIVMHACAKITLFFAAGAIYVASGRRSVATLDGIGRRMPWTMAAFTIASLGIIGLPPLGGFHSKWHLGLGALEAGSIWALVVLLVASLLAAGYLIPVIVRAYFATPADSQADAEIREAPLACLLPLLATAGLSVLLFFVPDPFGLVLE